MWISLTLLCIAFKSLSALPEPNPFGTLAQQLAYCKKRIIDENCLDYNPFGPDAVTIINPFGTLEEQLAQCHSHVLAQYSMCLLFKQQLDQCKADLTESKDEHQQCRDQLQLTFQDLQHAPDDNPFDYKSIINPFGTLAQQLDQCKKHIIDENCLGKDYDNLIEHDPFGPDADPYDYISKSIINNPFLTLAEQLDVCKRHVESEGCGWVSSDPCRMFKQDLDGCKTDLTESNNEHQQCRDQLQLTNQDLQHALDDDQETSQHTQFMTSLSQQLSDIKNQLNQLLGNCVEEWGKCGGEGYTGPTCCKDGYVCNYHSPLHSHCVPPDQVYRAVLY